MVIGPDGKTAYVTNTYEKTVSAINLKSPLAGKTYRTGKGPNGIAAH